MLCFFRQKTDYDLRISDWSSDVCSSDLNDCGCHTGGHEGWTQAWRAPLRHALDVLRDWGIEVMARRGPDLLHDPWLARDAYVSVVVGARSFDDFAAEHVTGDPELALALRSEEHTSELQSLMRISYAVFGLKKKKKIRITTK